MSSLLPCSVDRNCFDKVEKKIKHCYLPSNHVSYFYHPTAIGFVGCQQLKRACSLLIVATILSINLYATVMVGKVARTSGRLQECIERHIHKSVTYLLAGLLRPYKVKVLINCNLAFFTSLPLARIFWTTFNVLFVAMTTDSLFFLNNSKNFRIVLAFTFPIKNLLLLNLLTLFFVNRFLSLNSFFNLVFTKYYSKHFSHALKFTFEIAFLTKKRAFFLYFTPVLNYYCYYLCGSF